MNELKRQAVRYVGASAAALLVDIGVLALLVSVAHVPYLIAATISFLAGTVVVYWAAIRHIFEFRRLERWHHEFAYFTLIGLGGLTVNLTVMYALVDGLGLHYVLAKICAAGMTFAINFLLRRWLLFTSWRPEASSVPEARNSRMKI